MKKKLIAALLGITMLFPTATMAAVREKPINRFPTIKAYSGFILDKEPDEKWEDVDIITVYLDGSGDIMIFKRYDSDLVPLDDVVCVIDDRGTETKKDDIIMDCVYIDPDVVHMVPIP